MVTVLGLQSNTRTHSQDFLVQYADRLEYDLPINPSLKVSNTTPYTISSDSATKYRTKLVKALPGEFFRTKVTVGTFSLRRTRAGRWLNYKGYVDPATPRDFTLHPNSRNLGSIDNQDLLNRGNITDIATTALYDRGTLTLDFEQNLSLPALRLFYKDSQGNIFQSLPVSAQTTNRLSFSNIVINDTTLSTVHTQNIYGQLHLGDTFDLVLTTDLTVNQSQFERTLSGEVNDALATKWSSWQDLPSNKILSLPSVSDPNYYRIQCAEGLNKDPQNPVTKVSNTTSYTVVSDSATKYRTKRVKALAGEIFRAQITVGVHNSTHKGYSTGENTYGHIDTQDILNVGSTQDLKIFYVRRLTGVVFEFYSLLPLSRFRLFYYDQHRNTFYSDISPSTGTLSATIIVSATINSTSTSLDSTSIFSDLQENDTFEVVLTTDQTVTQAQFEASLSGGSSDALASAWSTWQDIPSNKILSLPTVSDPDYYRIQCADSFLPLPIYPVTQNASSGEYTVSSKTATKYRTSSDEGRTWNTWQDIPTTKILTLSTVSVPDYYRIRCADNVFSANLIPDNSVIKVSNATSYTLTTPSATSYRTQRVSALPGEVFRAKVTVGQPFISPSNTKGFSDLVSAYYGRIDNKDFLNLGTTDDIQYFTFSMTTNSLRIRTEVDVHPARVFYHDPHGNTFSVDTFARTTNALIFSVVRLNGTETLLNTTNLYNDLRVGDTIDLVICTGRTVGQTVTQAQFEASLSDGAEAALAAWSVWQDIPANNTITLPTVTPPDYYRIQCANRLVPDPSDTSNLVSTNPVIKVSNAPSYKVSAPSATKYQTQLVNALSGEVFRAKVTVGVSSVDNSKGFSDDTSPSVGLYGNIDNKDFLNLGHTDDIQYVAIALSRNIFVIRSSVPVEPARVFFHDNNNNSFYIDSQRINANSFTHAIINGRSTSLATTSIYSDLQTGGTFDVVISTDQTVTQAQFEASLSGGSEDALAAEWSTWQDIPVNKTLTLPTKTSTTLQMIKIPVSLLPTSTYTPSFFPSGYPTDIQVLATFEGRIRNWGDFNGINPSANNQGSWDTNQNTQTIGGVSYTVDRLVVSHGAGQLRFRITSSDTLDNNRTNLAGYSFFFYRRDDNGQLRSKPDNTPWIEEYAVANADTTHSTFTFIWNISTTLEQSVLYLARGSTESVPIGIKVAETSVET